MRLQTVIFWYLGVIGLLNVAAMGTGPDPPAAQAREGLVDSIRREMVAQDALLAGPFTARFDIEIERNLLGPDQTKSKKECHYTASGSTRGLSVKTEYDGNPPYGNDRTREWDFDADGNLIVWRSMRKISLSTADANKTYDEQQMLLVAPSGEILDRARHVMVYVYPLNSHDHFYEFDQFRMAAGRGFANEIEELKEQHTLSGGVQQLLFEGRNSSGLRGQWHLYVDRENFGLVRQADLFVPWVDRASVHLENRGVIQRDGLTLATDASLSFPFGGGHDYIQKFTVRDISAKTDEQHLDRIRAVFAEPLLPGAEILDLRASPPRRYPASAASEK